MCAGIRDRGGLLEERDLEGPFAEWMEPLGTDYRGYRILEQPPVSQGFVVLTMMNLLAGYDCKALSRTELAHVMVEAKKIAFEDRIKHLGDPRYGNSEIQRLISREYADQRRAEIGDTSGPVASSYAAAGADTTYLWRGGRGRKRHLAHRERLLRLRVPRRGRRHRPGHEQPPVQRQAGPGKRQRAPAGKTARPHPQFLHGVPQRRGSWPWAAPRGRTTSPRPMCRSCTTCWT